MTRDHFMKFFWGLAFIAIDIRLANVDFVPDLIGYALIWSGLDSLQHLHPRFGQARPFAIAALIVSLVDFVHPFLIIGVLLTVLHLVLIWHLCTGIMELAAGRGNTSLSNLANTVRKWSLALTLINVTLLPLGVQLPVVIMPLVIVTLAFGILLMIVMRRAALELTPS